MEIIEYQIAIVYKEWELVWQLVLAEVNSFNWDPLLPTVTIYVRTSKSNCDKPVMEPIHLQKNFLFTLSPH